MGRAAESPKSKQRSSPSPKKKPKKNETIDKGEFRVFLIALRQRLEYFQAFQAIDENHDGLLDLDEFLQAVPMMEKWVGKMDRPEKDFKLIDRDGGGQIEFDEFCNWSIKKNLDLDGHDDDNSSSEHSNDDLKETREIGPDGKPFINYDIERLL